MDFAAPSDHRVKFKEIEKNFCKKYTLALVYRECSVTTLFLPPTPLIVLFVAIRKYAIPLSEPLDDSPAKIEMV